MSKKKGVITISIILAFLLSASLGVAATIEFSIGDLLLGEEIYMFKLTGDPYNSDKVMGEVKPGSWTYSKTPATYQVYDFMYAMNDVKTPIVGDFLALTFDPTVDATLAPFSKDNFVLGGYESDQYYDLLIKYTYNEVAGNGRYEFSSVPIPGTVLLLGSGLLGVMGIGRRRMKKS